MSTIPIKEVKWHPKSNRISQVPKEGLEFAMLSKKYEQLNQLVWCKDFMHDIIWSSINLLPMEIYGFKYDPVESSPPCLTSAKLMITNFKDHDFEEKLKTGVLPLLHEVEKKIKMPLTYLEKCKTAPPIYKKSGVWILNGSKRWIKSPPMLSFYTLLIRIGLVHSASDTLMQTIEKITSDRLETYYDKNHRDKHMIENAYSGILKIMKYTDKKLFHSNMRLNYPSFYETKTGSKLIPKSQIHDMMGIVGFSLGKTKEYVPYWK